MRVAEPFAGAAAITLSLAAGAHAQQGQPSSAVAEARAPQAERWVRIAGSTDLDQEYLDKESVRRTGNKVTLWTRRDLAPGQGSVWNELEFDCSTRTYTLWAYIRDDGGIITHNTLRPHRRASPIPAGSVEANIFNLACR